MIYAIVFQKIPKKASVAPDNALIMGLLFSLQAILSFFVYYEWRLT